PGAKSGDLLYVGQLDLPGVVVYQYPSGKLAGEIWGRGQVEGLCTDAAGNVFIASVGLGEIFEYAHGGQRPIATLKDPGEVPWGCAIDPKTGDLAVANDESGTGPPGSVSIYKNAKGKPAVYPDTSEFQYIFFVAYGADGTLYLVGQTYAAGFGVASFSNGKFTPITLDVNVNHPRTMQGVGSKLDLADDDILGQQVIYQFAIHGSKGTKVGATTLKGAYIDTDFEVVGNAVVVANSYGYSGSKNGNVQYFKYPGGGSPTKTITYSPYFLPQALTISEVK
ncbi:MAG TPA: hypothetical protein VGI19_00180, partial [Candidatus Cybelea sp.]